jgi:hypothetical protein
MTGLVSKRFVYSNPIGSRHGRIFPNITFNVFSRDNGSLMGIVLPASMVWLVAWVNGLCICLLYRIDLFFTPAENGGTI